MGLGSLPSSPPSKEPGTSAEALLEALPSIEQVLREPV